MTTKQYKITFCLQAGYAGTGKHYTQGDAKGVIERWMIEGVQKDARVVNGVLTFGTLLFPAKGRREDGALVTVADTGVYSGNIFYDNDEKKLDDAEVKNVLNSLASALKNELEQDRVYLVYGDEAWYL